MLCYQIYLSCLLYSNRYHSIHATTSKASDKVSRSSLFPAGFLWNCHDFAVGSSFLWLLGSSSAWKHSFQCFARYVFTLFACSSLLSLSPECHCDRKWKSLRHSLVSLVFFDWNPGPCRNSPPFPGPRPIFHLESWQAKSLDYLHVLHSTSFVLRA